MKNAGKWLAIAIVLLLVYFGWKWWSGSDEPAGARRGKADLALVLDRVWIDQIPEANTDYMQVFVVLADHPVGIFQKTSSYRGEAELFQFQRDGNKISLLFPQSNTNKKFTFKVTHCDELPPFDLCLDVSKNPWGGPKRYYSDSEQSGAAAVDTYLELLPANAPKQFTLP